MRVGRGGAAQRPARGGLRARVRKTATLYGANRISETNGSPSPEGSLGGSRRRRGSVFRGCQIAARADAGDPLLIPPAAGPGAAHCAGTA
jgi:hypothetical protein